MTEFFSDDDQKPQFNCSNNVDDSLKEELNQMITNDSIFSCGQYGKAFILRHRSFENKMCVKLIGFRKENPSHDDIEREFNIQIQFKHPNIVPIVNSLDLPNNGTNKDILGYVCFIMPYYPLKDLYYYLLDQPNHIIQIKEVQCIGKQILEALIYMNGVGYFHNDLKLENVLIKKENGFTVAALCDFGFTQLIRDDKDILYYDNGRGTLLYNAPEKHRGDNKSDNWSFGIILYMMAYGKYPFYDPPDVYKSLQYHILITRSNIQYPDNPDNIDEFNNLKDLLEGLLKLNPNERITLEAARDHPFFKDVDVNPVTLTNPVDLDENGEIDAFEPEVIDFTYN